VKLQPRKKKLFLKKKKKKSRLREDGKKKKKKHDRFRAATSNHQTRGEMLDNMAKRRASAASPAPDLLEHFLSRPPSAFGRRAQSATTTRSRSRASSTRTGLVPALRLPPRAGSRGGTLRSASRVSFASGDIVCGVLVWLGLAWIGLHLPPI
jgi:hypothetical protein